MLGDKTYPPAEGGGVELLKSGAAPSFIASVRRPKTASSPLYSNLRLYAETFWQGGRLEFGSSPLLSHLRIDRLRRAAFDNTLPRDEANTRGNVAIKKVANAFEHGQGTGPPNRGSPPASSSLPMIYSSEFHQTPL